MLSDIAAAKWRFCWRFLLGPMLWALLGLCISQIGPSWSAHLGHGQARTWTVTRIVCDKHHQGCDDRGRFVSDSGSDVRSDIEIAGGSTLVVGSSLPAVDAGGMKVYPPGGGHDWWLYPAATLVVAALCWVWVWTFPVEVIRRRRAARKADHYVANYQLY